MTALHLYVRYLGVSLRSQLQYRASVVMQSIGAFMITAVEFIAIMAPLGLILLNATAPADVGC